MEPIPAFRAEAKGDVYEYMLSKIASAGQNGQFRTPRHIIRLMVEMTVSRSTIGMSAIRSTTFARSARVGIMKVASFMCCPQLLPSPPRLRREGKTWSPMTSYSLPTPTDVICDVAAGAHGDRDPGVAGGPAEREADVLAAVVGVMAQPWTGPPRWRTHSRG